MPGTAREHHGYTVDEWKGPFMRILEEIPEVSVCYDVGANGGGFSSVILERYPGSKVIAIEPVGANFETLKEMVPEASHLKAAVQYGTRETRMFWRGGNVGAYFTEEVDAGPDKSFSGETADCVTLEEIAPPPDLVKLDVEGAEVNIISHSTVLRRTRNVIVEWHPDLDPYQFLSHHLPDHEIRVDIDGKQILLCLR